MNMDSVVSIKHVLTRNSVSASAPCRIDTGGTWDIKALALPLSGISPITVNISLDLRTSVSLLPFDDGAIRISSHGFSEEKVFSADSPSFEPPFGLFMAAVSYFGFHGFEIRIESQSPVKSGLGGSSTALVALIKALSKVRKLMGDTMHNRDEILHLAYHMEDGVSGGNCGVQDQAAAVYGGVNAWKWQYGDRNSPFIRVPLLDTAGQKELTDRLLVAFSGKSHESLKINKNWIRDFLAGRTRREWIMANEIVQGFFRSLSEKDWKKAAGLLREEMVIRRKITPEALIPETSRLIGLAEDAGCGARFAGAGAGGSVWAIGGKKDIDILRNIWEEALSTMKRGKIIHCRVDSKGLQ